MSGDARNGPGGELRVGVNLLWLVPGVVGGSEDYTARLLASYAEGRSSRDPALVLYVNRAFRAAHPDLVGAFPTVDAPLDGRHKARRVAVEATWLSRRARRDGVSIVHHMGGNLLRARPPGIVTIHDLQPLAHPANFSWTKSAYLRATLPRALRRASLVVTLSQHTRHDVAERLGVALDDIVIVPPGVVVDDQPPDPAALAGVRARYGLKSRPFFLYPAITYPHKNHVTLVRAFARVAEQHPDVVLVLTGGPAEAEAEVVDEIQRSGHADRILRPGRIPRVDLDLLLAAATALTCPSTYEGFGIPVLEAMSRGCPVVASAATALPEVVDDAGLLVEPHDVDGWADAMDRLLQDRDQTERLVEAGLARARSFSWEASGQALAAAYATVATRVGAGSAS
jgi:alpha-1,3-rhamnosyl/mannosyltransferase